jgi:hypothetical protein
MSEIPHQDAYVWLVLITDFKLFLVRAFNQYHGIPKIRFNTGMMSPIDALSDLRESLGLDLILKHDPFRLVTYESCPIGDQKFCNFCYVYELPTVFDVRHLPDIKHLDPEHPKYDRRIWDNYSSLLMKFKVNRPTFETLEAVLKIDNT